MNYIPRSVQPLLHHHLGRGKSVLLLGPRQTGKTTLLEHFEAELRLSLVQPGTRQEYERDPARLAREIEALPRREELPLVILDEVQKVPELLDVVQDAVDRELAQFVLCGSSARRLRRGGANLLPGRVVTVRLDPLSLEEVPEAAPHLEQLLYHGSLPGIWTVPDPSDREVDLESYVQTYLEQEVRSEALVRSLGSFARFLELAALESGRPVSFRSLSQEVGVSHTTISSYYSILEDCLIAERIDPLTRSTTRKKLSRSCRYMFFDLGVRRRAAREGTQLGPERLGQLFEQFVGLELLRRVRRLGPGASLQFWRDPDGPEVDWVLGLEGSLYPVEVKWTGTPRSRDIRHLKVFLDEYPEAETGYLVCRIRRPQRLEDRIHAVPWTGIPTLGETR